MATAGAGAGAPPRNEEPLVDVARAGRGIRIELRYATRDNITREPLYPQSARCLLRASVVERLRRAQMSLKRAGAGLKIWDAYRPPWAQRILWNRAPHPQFVGDPARGGSLHTWGVAVDVTLVDALGRELKMPSAFDDFSQAAARRYSGKDEAVSRNLRLLQNAMTSAGFLVMRDDWWHFVAADYREFAPVDAPLAP
jgi:D-alanyl-D-alanine dipeptidase